MSAPLYQLKAEFFTTLGHPVRIRAVELLSEREREHAVAETLPGVGILSGAPAGQTRLPAGRKAARPEGKPPS
ncbi:hypothetical protein ACGFYV_05265 [Streptomyces sp. NPDC048297]|uniref:hypothetical protein n=1 Tax=Streptomyces sp. NPDC048297 TaxID=3365531 RepID=UPI0037171051